MKKDISWPAVLCFSCTISVAIILFVIIGFIFLTALPVLIKNGLYFFYGTTWGYGTGVYGSLNFITGTLVLTGVTITMAFPISLFTAVYLSEWAPPWIEAPLRTLIELLVGIPSVVYGIFGFFLLRPLFSEHVDPAVSSVLGFIPFFQDPHPVEGTGIFLASIILTIMILPTVTALSQEAMKSVPFEFREASFALGATKWETIQKVVLPTAFPGIITGIILGLMRAMGETMAVVMLIGNRAIFPTSLFGHATPLTSKILNDVGHWIATPDPRAAIFGLALVLFLMEIVFVGLIRLVSAHFSKKVRYNV